MSKNVKGVLFFFNFFFSKYLILLSIRGIIPMYARCALSVYIDVFLRLHREL